MHLFPSKSQVTEMLQCARQCGRRNGTSPFLTFGEFCVFAREMQRPKSHRKLQLQQRSNSKHLKKCDVFLGGSCNPTTWRTDIAIPELQKHGISYYNPQKSVWGPELVAEEHDAKQSASVLLFVVDSQTRSVSSMIEVAYLVACDRCVVVVTHPYQLGQSIMGEELSYREYIDLVDGQSALLTLLKIQKVKVHCSLTAALSRTTNLLENYTTQEGMGEQQITTKLRTLKDTFDYYDEKQTGELHLNEVLDAYYRLTNRTLQISELYNYLSLSNNTDTTKIKISFEQFCTLVAEYNSNGYNNFITDDWASRPLHHQFSTNNNIHCDTFSINLNDHTSNKDIWNTDIYLGGSSQSKSMWRENIAIPLLKKYGLTYYNPAMREMQNDAVVNETNGTLYLNEDEETISNDVLQWKKSMDRSKILLFVVTEDSRSLSSMILAAHYIGLGRKNVVLCIQQLPLTDCSIGNETLTKQAVKDYNRGRVYLSDVAKRNQLSVFENITEAVQCAIEKCQSQWK